MATTGRRDGKTPAVAPYGLKLQRYFTAPGDDGFANVEWELRTAAITGENGKMVFEQRDVEVPKSWSQTATNVVVQKYFRGTVGTPERERSVRQLISRVADTITNWGKKDGYFADDESARVFNAELKHLLVAAEDGVQLAGLVQRRHRGGAAVLGLLHQQRRGHDGVDPRRSRRPRACCSSTARAPARTCRRSGRRRSCCNGGGTASGPVSFMRGFDAFAGVIKSGGKTRRAAKMVILNIDHPDVDEFIWCKAKEEKKAWTLIDAGYDGSFDGEAYKSVFFQNSNNSVRVTDDFMEAVQKDRDWATARRARRQPGRDVKARDLWRDIADGGVAVRRPRPAVRHDDQRLAHVVEHGAHQRVEPVQRVHVPRRLGVQPRVAEPAQVREPRRQRQRRRVRRRVVPPRRRDRRSSARRSSSATPSTRPSGSRDNSHRFRPLGLGYANLGALLMSRGLPYDSAPARAYAGAITALMTGWAYRTSAVIARDVTGPFDGYAENREPFLGVMKKHRRAVDKIDATLRAGRPDGRRARRLGSDASRIGKEYGYRNGQATVLAPTGTIGFMMDCDTTGIEPDIALIKYKRLVGGGMIKIVNNTITEALAKLGYDEEPGRRRSSTTSTPRRRSRARRA